MENRSSASDYLVSDSLEKKLRQCQRRLLPFMEFDDVLQEYRLTILEGKSVHQTLDQFCIDLYRKNKKYLSERSIDEAEEALATFLDPTIRDVVKRLKDMRGYDRIIVFMVCVYGASNKEISIMMDVSESRISKAVSEIVKRMNARNS